MRMTLTFKHFRNDLKYKFFNDDFKYVFSKCGFLSPRIRTRIRIQDPGPDPDPKLFGNAGSGFGSGSVYNENGSATLHEVNRKWFLQPCIEVVLSCYLGYSEKTSFFRGIPFRSLPFRASELTLPCTSKCLGMSTFFCGITKNVPSLFRGIFSEQNSVANPSSG